MFSTESGIFPLLVTEFRKYYRIITICLKPLTRKKAGCKISVQMKVGRVGSRFSYGNGMPR